jgi:tetratricopeptide (TPR) repeat protein
MDFPSIHNTLQILIEKADQLNQSGQPQLAVEMLSKGIEHAPHDRALHDVLAEILIQNEHYQDALGALEKLVNKDFDPRLTLMRCRCLEGLERYREAEDLVDRVIAADEGCAEALNLKGGLLYHRNMKQAAEQCFADALRIDPFNGRVSMNLGLLKLEAGQSDAAFADLEQAFDLSPQVKEIAETFHDIVSELGLYAYAEPMFHNACGRFPHNKRLAYLLIDLLIQQNKTSEAMDKIEDALAVFGVEDGILEPALSIRRSLGPLPVAGRKGTVSLCMIVKNEEKHLARCLASVKTMVDEIVIIDTGSSDRTQDIATVFGAAVFTHDWRDDFAQARNDALSEATGEWVLILDADEVIAAGDRDRILNCTNRGTGETRAYSFITRNYTHDVGVESWHANDGDYRQQAAGSGWYPSEKVRLFPNDDRFRFENAVHELVEPSLRRHGVAIKRCPAPVHHYGELCRQETGDKKTRYYALGKKKIAADRSGPAALIEHAIQAQEVGDCQKALELWQKVLTHCPDLAKAYFNMSYCYIQLEQYSQGIRAATQALELDPELKEAVLNRALCQLRSGECSLAVNSLNKFLADTPGHPLATGLMAIANCIVGNAQLGIGQFDELNRLGFNCREYIYDHARKLMSAGRRSDAASILAGLAASRHADGKIRGLLDRLKSQQKP